MSSRSAVLAFWRWFHETVRMHPELIQPEHLPPRLRWEKLFGFLPPVSGQTSGSGRRGRKPVVADAMLKALVLQRLQRLRFLRHLHSLLMEHPPTAAACGFDPYGVPPSLERFSSFLKDTPNGLLAGVRIALVNRLYDQGVVTGANLGIDSCPVPSWVRENNLKTSMGHALYDKTRLPRGDRDARLGVRVHFPRPGEKVVVYFWGYRNHVVSDLDAEVPMWEVTAPCSVSEVALAIPLLKATGETFGLNVQSVCADAEYDAEKILRFIVDGLKAEPFVPRQPRNAQDPAGFQREANGVTCPGGLAMYRKGKMTRKGITRIQFSCPFHYGRKPELLMCPVDHPKFSSQKGCNYLWRVTESIRDSIPYGSSRFKERYKSRTGAERLFSRLLAVTLEEPSVRGLNSVRNHCTISHIAVLLVAVAAHELGHDDKLRFVRTFVPDVLT